MEATMSLQNVLASAKMKCTPISFNQMPSYMQSSWQRQYFGSAYKIVLTYNKKRLTTYFAQGSAHTKEPTLTMLLECLAVDAECGATKSFEEFCSDLGYSEDSINALKIYKECQKTKIKLDNLFPDDMWLTFKENQ